MPTTIHTEWNSSFGDNRDPDEVAATLKDASVKRYLYVELVSATGPTGIYVNAAKVRYVIET